MERRGTTLPKDWRASHYPLYAQGMSTRPEPRPSRWRLWACCLLMGFASGLPYYVLVSLLPAWLRQSGVGLAEIGLFAWLRLPYTWKFLWSPLLDRFDLGWPGRRRDWAIACQALLVSLLLAFGFCHPQASLSSTIVVAGLVATFSATQDIAIDAYRRELLLDNELGFGNSLAVNGYRSAGLIPGGLALWLADRVAWRTVHWVVAGCMLIGIGATLLAPDVAPSERPVRSLASAIVDPFREFFQRQGWRSSCVILAFLVLYKLGDNMATSLVTPFYIDLGFSLSEIGTLVKLVALWSTIGGSLIGGAIMLRIGINRALWVFGLVQMLSILGFAALAVIGKNHVALGAAVMFEYLGIGLGTAAFVAFLAKVTSKRFTATQYALFSSVAALPAVALGSVCGVLVELLGFRDFYFLCTAAALPGLLLLPRIAPWNEGPAQAQPETRAVAP